MSVITAIAIGFAIGITAVPILLGAAYLIDIIRLFLTEDL